MPTIKLLKRKRDSVTTQKKGKYQEVYQDKRWKKLRTAKMRSNPLCERCEKYSKVKPTEEVHHIVPHDINPDLAFEWDNLMSVCVECHKILDRELK